MTLSSIFRSRNSKRFSVNDKKLIYTKTSLVLHLPEILTVIFSFLNQYTLKNTIRYVCKQWLSIARQYICIQGLWKDLTSDGYSHELLLAHLHQVTDLRIVYEQFWGLDETSKKWNMLSEKIDALRNSNQLHITKLVFNNARQIMYPILPKINTITNIQIHRVLDYCVHLGLILSSCPKLRFVSIGHENSRDYFEIQDDLSTKGSETALTSISKVESIILKGAHVDPAILGIILSRCPQLQVLKMVEVIQARSLSQPIDRAGFFAKIATSCPKLKHFHFSIQDQSMNVQDAQALSLMFSENRNSSVQNCQNQSTRHHPHLYLDTISVLDKDIKSDIVISLFAPTIDSSFNNVITTLEIMPARDRMQCPYISRALHTFLCAAPSLLHLLAPTVPYFAEYLDLQGPTFADGFYYPRSCAQARLVSNTHFLKKEIWACRQLRTLQIKFISRDMSDYAGAENARIMFGYISKVCPNLRELAIDRKELRLNFDGGLCLLSRLRYLQRLTILTWTKTKLEKKDLDWMARPTLEESIQGNNNATTQREFRSGTKGLSISFTGKNDADSHSDDRTLSRDVTVQDVENIGSIAHLKECRNQLARNVDHEGCWPMLEFLGLKLLLLYKGDFADPEVHLPIMIADIRPGLEFSCNYCEW
ncbi:hypothetical protein BGZ49_001757 [Haplosporangium sp. Z 27]|nr:hypothetical protein BGZ49_001757 [Haplosporangium sp. Z 27]